MNYDPYPYGYYGHSVGGPCPACGHCPHCGRGGEYPHSLRPVWVVQPHGTPGTPVWQWSVDTKTGTWTAGVE